MSEHSQSYSMQLNKLKWAFFRVSDALSLVAKLALLLLLITLVYAGTVYFPQQRALAHLTQLSSARLSSPQVNISPAQPLQDYVAEFPKQATRAGQLKRLVDIAKQEELLLDEVTYQTKQQDAQVFSQTSVDFTVIDSYPNIHHFLNRVLVEMPFVGIETLSLRRENVLDSAVEARIRLTIYFAQSCCGPT
jgi:hypothetical protein